MCTFFFANCAEILYFAFFWFAFFFFFFRFTIFEEALRWVIIEAFYLVPLCLTAIPTSFLVGDLTSVC
jgi:hypothetical protein